GTKVSLSDYVGKGRYALVHFWASWAAPCRKSFPHLLNFYRGHKKTLDMLGIAVWDKPEDSRAAIYNYDLEYPQIVNANETHTKLYNIDSVPHLILFDPDGRIIMQGSYSEDFLMEVKSIIYKN
ncbi:MAG: TlpA family protein disulfide reductase, partial [Bacteroidaceae bacterium]|nr:TlpA family protein disulfide reductase [Bacteroidaceae bacterium]